LDVVLCVKEERGIPKTPQKTIFIGTPGHIKNMERRKQINLGSERIKAVYALEIDTLLDARSYNDTFEVFKPMNPECQVVLMGSTYPDFVRQKAQMLFLEDDEKKEILKSSFIPNKHWYVGCRADHKKPQMLELLCNNMNFTQAIIYIDQKAAKHNYYTDELVNMNNRAGQSGKILNTTNSEERRRIVQKFNKQEIKILICHDIPLFGINTSNVDIIVHADLPSRTNSSEITPVQAAMDIYERRNNNISNKNCHSIVFTIRTQENEKICDSINDTYGLEQLPSDPNSVDERFQ